jgi:hypothetical protein
MPNGLYNIEILMRMSKNVREQNEDWRRDVFTEGAQRYKEVMHMIALFEQEYGNLERERQRLEQYAPTQGQRLGPEPEMPKAVTKGPAS